VLDNLTMSDNLINGLALFWLFFCWIAYSLFAKVMAKRTASLSSLLHDYRIDWMKSMVTRDIRIADATMLASLERSVNFFASTTLLILAGLLAVLTRSGEAFTALEHLAFASANGAMHVQFKLLVIIGILVYAFFTFTWSMRQYSFCNVLMGAATNVTKSDVNSGIGESFTLQMAKVLDQAGHSYNYGLRSYYFAMAATTWFVDAWIFMATVTFVIAILYRREFHSRPVQAMRGIKRT
jgi:uncharacterized membrane protein|tara:strand:+ start:500 stop:1213 length:714 start_codon:yes stop_codon:yes gene_type:complete